MNCIVCWSSKSNIEFEKWGYNFCKCNECYTLFQDPIIEKEIDDYYENIYYNENRPFEQFINYFNKEKNSNIIKKIKKIKKTWKLLDIWASYWFFVKNCIDANIESYWVEPNKEAVKIWKEKLEVNIDNGFFNEEYRIWEKFDIITNFHVIEHLINPNEFILNIYNKLHENWILVLETPNLDSFNSKRLKENWPFVIPNEHLVLFSKKSLQYLLEKNGFKIILSKSIWPFIYKRNTNITHEIRSNNPSMKIKTLKYIYNFISDKFNLGDHILIIAQKE